MVVMDKEDYTDKALLVLANTSTYRIINKDPTTKLRNKLTQTLRDIKQNEGLSDPTTEKCIQPVPTMEQAIGQPTQ